MLKRLFESYLLLSRWLLAPLLVIMTFALFALVLKAGKKVVGLFGLLVGAQDEHLILAILSLVDTTLTGALVVLVTISVYENFVSPVSPKDHAGWPDWMGNIDFSHLKLKLMSTIIAISTIKLLEVYLDTPELSNRDLFFYIAIQATFVFSTLALALAERLSGHDTRGDD